ncbi:uncharacterized protein F4807DRAFT_444146 [Annulohypoxylon truncatum]|uniref:uncharacterized protein n=1 Tax=Annulohypoxylon truncatum TaxID=327061 RepID=UPI00200845C0|nr:uncharacterized protein F4807DRAFT_444146 [Annulohypoxylon truncatum]KAI1205137.1 hypothetical protein F4807DRAFT_444146 [Annulohypoxylon truncatum]
MVSVHPQAVVTWSVGQALFFNMIVNSSLLPEFLSRFLQKVMGSLACEIQEEKPRKEEYDIYQDVLSQFPFLNGYTHTLRAFETSQATSREAIVADLQTALDELRSKIPWLANQVVTVDAGPGTSNFITSAPWPASAPPNNVVRADHDADFPPLSSILASGGPMSTFGPANLVPCPGLPHPHGLSPIPILIIRAVFITGGVLVVLSAHHNMVDGTGLMQLWDHMATLMNGDSLSPKALQWANADRTRVVPLLRPNELVKDYSHLLRPNPWPLGPPPETIWRGFTVSRSALAEIKDRASPQTEGAFVSTDDALSAFCWQRICAVRLSSGRCHATQLSKFGRAVNARRAVGLPDTYLGQMVVHATTRLPLGDVVAKSVAELAGMLRRDLEDARTEWSVRSCATFMAGVPDKSKLLYGGLYNPATDIGGSSLLTWGSRPFRMGALGESRMFRKPDGPRIPGCMYFFPSDNEREMQLVLCLTREDLHGLSRDTEWDYFVKGVGSLE